MTVPSRLYRPSLALLTDFYELTMAAAAWKSGVAGKEAVFHLSFRRNPFEGGYAVAAGLEDVVDRVLHHRFTPDDLGFLAGHQGSDGSPLFEPAFLDWLSEMRLDVDVDDDAGPPEKCRKHFRWQIKSEPHTAGSTYEYLIRFTGPARQSCVKDPFVRNG